MAFGDHLRLQRAFEVPPTKTRFAVVSTAGAALIGLAAPGAFLVAGGLAAGFGGIYAADRAAVQRGLAELAAWGFPVDGYREWLLASEPTFDLVLARALDVDVFATSVRAIDRSIVVERLKNGAMRVVTKPVALPPLRKRGKAVWVGDRRLLHELHARVLGPLHADVGIRSMRMGERATLPQMPAELIAGTEPPPSDAMGAFRDQAMVAPPALQALVEVGGDREMPREARKLSRRAERVVYASGSSPHGVGTVAAFTVGGMTTGVGWFELVGMGIGSVIGFTGGVIAAINGNRRNADRIADSVRGHGFPIDGYDDWLISGRPLLDIELVQPIDPTWLSAKLAALPRAFSMSANAEVDWVVAIQWFDTTHVRIESRPSLIEPQSRIEPFYGGSHEMFRTFIEQVAIPLHQHAGIKEMRMGGYIDRRV